MNALLRNEFKREKISIAKEMIEHQNNDYVVSTLNDLFQEIINCVKETKIKKSSSLHKHPFTLNIINKINYTIKERFGLDTQLVAVDGSENFGVYVSSPRDVDTIHTTMFSEIMDELKSMIEWYNVNETNAKTKHEVQELSVYDIKSKDNLSFLYNYRKSIMALRDKMCTSSVIVDTKKAKIIGLPNEYIAYVNHDVVPFIKKLNFTAEELTAVFLHEIGHAFTYIEYSYRSVTNTSVLMDTYLDNLTKKNKTPKESLVLAYEKVSKDKNTEYKTKDLPTATIYMMDSYLKENRFSVTGSAHPGTDSEQLADQFASRFGVGAHLVSGLDKFRKEFDEKILGAITYSLGSISIIFGSCVVFYLVASVMAAAAVFAIFGLLAALCVLTIDNPMTSDSEPLYVNTYDDAKRRYERIRNDYIRRLRSNPSATKADIETTIETLKKIDEVIKATPDAKISVIDKLFRVFSSATKHRLEIRNIERMIEDLSENNLYLAAAKLKSKI